MILGSLNYTRTFRSLHLLTYSQNMFGEQNISQIFSAREEGGSFSITAQTNKLLSNFGPPRIQLQII